jgi:ADP-ribose pyrophosphatase
MSHAQPGYGPFPDAAIVVARDADGLVALLSAPFPDHGGDYLFLPGGRKGPGETYEECARRGLREEGGITATTWRPLREYAERHERAALVARHFHAARQWDYDGWRQRRAEDKQGGA